MTDFLFQRQIYPRLVRLEQALIARLMSWMYLCDIGIYRPTLSLQQKSKQHRGNLLFPELYEQHLLSQAACGKLQPILTWQIVQLYSGLHSLSTYIHLTSFSILTSATWDLSPSSCSHSMSGIHYSLISSVASNIKSLTSSLLHPGLRPVLSRVPVFLLELGQVPPQCLIDDVLVLTFAHVQTNGDIFFK